MATLRVAPTVIISVPVVRVEDPLGVLVQLSTSIVLAGRVVWVIVVTAVGAGIVIE